MAEKFPAGESQYGLEFVTESVNKDYFCPVNLEVMRDPHQPDCCGHHLSAGVAERLTKENHAVQSLKFQDSTRPVVPENCC